MQSPINKKELRIVILWTLQRPRLKEVNNLQDVTKVSLGAHIQLADRWREEFKDHGGGVYEPGLEVAYVISAHIPLAFCHVPPQGSMESVAQVIQAGICHIF